MVKLNFPNDSKERALKRLEEIRKINTAIANKTTIKKKTAKKLIKK